MDANPGARGFAACLGLLILSTTAACRAPSPTGPSPGDGWADPATVAVEVYERVAPAIAYVDTPLSTGSAVLVSPERVLTNAHVLWPEEHVRLVFPDGREIDEAKVLARDELRDLALVEAPGIGIEGDDVQPLELGDADEPPIGASVFLVGYPAEIEAYPQPAITSGILSLRRHWQAGDLSYLQTDADIAGGQSGGALVNARGEMLAVSGLIFGEGGFALAADAAEALDHLSDIESGANEGAVEALRTLPIPAEDAPSEVDLTLEGPFEEAGFLISPDFGDDVSVTVSVGGQADVFLELLSPYGDVEIDADEEGAGGRETGRFTALSAGPHVIVVGRLDGNPVRAAVRVEASLPLQRLQDPDDGRLLRKGDVIVGSLDHPGDIDLFELQAAEEGSLTVTVDTANFVPDLYAEAMDGPADSGLIPGATGEGNRLGLASRVFLPARGVRRWSIRVADLDGIANGGYFLIVE